MLLGYNSVFDVLQDIIRDVPMLVVLSVIVALIPIALYRMWRAPSYRALLITGILFLRRIGSDVHAYTRRKELDEQTNMVYKHIAGRKVEFRDILNSGTYLVMLTVVILVLKKVFFFGLITSWSMAPTIMPSDLVLIEALTTDNVEIGDIVLYTKSKGYPPIIHRVVRINGENIQTKGDNARIDSWTIRKKDIKGKAVIFNGKPLVIKNIGNYFMVSKTPGPQDPMFKFIGNAVKAVHIYGPVLLALLLLVAMLGSFKTKKAYV